MKWQDIKFWCWLELEFPQQLTFDPFDEADLLADLDADESDMLFGAGEGPQGAQCHDREPGIVVCFELISFNSEFELNSIPTANVSVALGRRADDVNTASEIHYWIDELKLQLPAKVWCMAKSPQSSDGPSPLTDAWPVGKFKIFDGYATGSGFRRTGGGAELTLGLTHWLTDLSFSSAVSKQSHPLNPAQFFYPANFTLGDAQSGGGLLAPGPFLVTPQLALPFFDEQTVFNDFWGGTTLVDVASGKRIGTGLKQWLVALSQNDRINSDQIVNIATGGVTELFPHENWEACRALARFEPSAKTPELDENGYVLGVPLGMVDVGDFNFYVALSIANEVGVESLEGYTNVTFWDKLAGQFHANYMFSIVPLVDKALVVPFVPGLSSGDELDMVHRVLQTSDYESIDLQSVHPRPLRAIGVTMNHNYEAGGSMTHDPPAQYASFGGWFDKMVPADDPDLNPGGIAPTADQRYKEGLIRFVEGPKWMSNFVSNFLHTAGSTGVGGTIRTPLSPAGGNEPQHPGPREMFQNARPVWDLYARAVYIHEILKNRQGIISGPVRFDVAPGSQLKIEATEDKFVKHVVFSDIQFSQECDEQYFKFFWCSVLRVSTTIDCQNMRAYTNFQVAHIRDRKENKEVGTAIGRHPLWQRCRWAGCVLVQDEAFQQVATRDTCDE
jgi:hypothetical protein